ncbi:hypothetical protein M6B38_323775 [Iris pallida]|uniref:Uncharacterized protein n=1 Tax=Iris pallida TaxID=29817 RepID=A0AAX6H7R9_IRIPA|nr:hypothetical protein M6B38_160530 [Iris pallida]KAJ6809404.1 hypothetical protein M6B38_160535 [Iris pallida]KAJ6837059.1 hypothetical protein M6B38_323775 [Iris pallida]
MLGGKGQGLLPHDREVEVFLIVGASVTATIYVISSSFIYSLPYFLVFSLYII